jgi:concanavalin A-like lectin/glucanase superfamily protein
MRPRPSLTLAALLTLLIGCFTVGITTFPACTKVSPIHDTTTVIKNDTFINIKHDTTVKNDTTRLTDTLYATKTDPTVNLTKGLLLYLPFSGNIADSSGNGNPTTALNGASLTYDTHGYANQAFGADGTNKVVLVTNNGSINFDTAWSVSLDFMTMDVSTSRHVMLSMIDWTNGYGPSFEIGNGILGVPDNMFEVGAMDISAGCSNYGNANPNILHDSTGFVPVAGAWYNAVVIYHRGSEQFYLNGKLFSSKAGTGTLANLCSASNIVVGGWSASDPVNLNGKLDNIRLYNRVLTPHEITALAANYQVTSTAVRPGLRTH